MLVVVGDSGNTSLDDELIARGTVVPTTEGAPTVPAVTVMVEYTVPTQCNDGEGVGHPVTVMVE